MTSMRRLIDGVVHPVPQDGDRPARDVANASLRPAVN